LQIGPEMVKAWALEIEGSWTGAKVQRVESADLWAALELFPKGWLLFSWFPESCGCGCVGKGAIEALLGVGRRKPPIALALKSELAGARLLGAEQVNFDRLLSLRFSRPVGLGISQDRVLILEASPRFSNLLLADGSLKVLERASHGRPAEMGADRTKPGFRYIAPPGVQGLPPTQWPENIRPETLPRLKGIGKGLVSALSGHWDEVPEPGEKLGRLYSPEESATPACWKLQRFEKALLAFPVVIPGSVELGKSPLEATGHEIVEGLLEQAARRKSLPGIRPKGDGDRHIRNRLEGLKKQLEESSRADLLKKWGEALLSASDEGFEGKKEVEVSSWGHSGPETIRVPVDPRLTRIQNAQLFFSRYRKANSVFEQVKVEIRKLEAEIAEMEQDGVLAEALALLGRKAREKLSKPSREKTGNKAPGVRRFEIGGFPVLVGTSAKGNRQVTFRLSSPEDLWFHAKDVPGAHVIVKTGKREVPEWVVGKAAAIAAFFSKARGSEAVVVEMTEKRHVRSRNSESPGAVFYTDSTALTVRPAIPGGDP